MIRKQGVLEEVEWDEAINYTASRLNEIKENMDLILLWEQVLQEDLVMKQTI